jgi:hypothetical protein
MAEIIPFERIALQRQLERGGMPSRRLLEHALQLAIAKRRHLTDRRFSCAQQR